MLEPVLHISTFVFSILLTGIFRYYALKKGVIDIPNHRSSHKTATPRGGGTAIVVSYLAVLFVLLAAGGIRIDTFLALSLGGGLAAAVGALDDYRSIKISWRLLIHSGAAVWGLYWLGGIPEILIGNYQLEPGWLANLVGIIFLAWFLNLFNFMDGIDGIAASEAVFVSSGAALIIWFGGGQNISLMTFFSCACLGFLCWNWPPARIFMGDAGSGFLGIVLGLLAVQTARFPEISIWSWLILSAVFIVDATVTLLRRIITGKPWYRAHRNHCYQILARRWQSHRKVTVLLLLINLFWLLPLAFLSALKPSHAFSLTLTAWLPLICAVYLAGAGAERP
ncbi:MAG: glycosyltransferase family 4 protein [Desulfonatronovibrio sp.]